MFLQQQEHRFGMATARQNIKRCVIDYNFAKSDYDDTHYDVGWLPSTSNGTNLTLFEQAFRYDDVRVNYAASAQFSEYIRAYVVEKVHNSI